MQTENNVVGTERYILKERIASGGMGEVYRAYDRWAQKSVALKMMLDVPSGKKYERFMREIRIATSLSHDNVLTATDSGKIYYQGREVPFLISPLVRDGSLADFIKREPPIMSWSLLQTADVIVQAAQGLQYLHEQNKVHQDVKPGNFLITIHRLDNRLVHIRLTDFGITREIKIPAVLASEGIGTFLYMAPEQIHLVIDPASDQYALAVMACLLLTGEFPLKPTNPADNNAIMKAHLDDMPTPPSRLKPDRITSRAVDSIIMKALEKKPEARFARILDFAEALFDAIETQVRDAPMVLKFNNTLAIPSLPPTVLANPLGTPLNLYVTDEADVVVRNIPPPPKRTTLSRVSAKHTALPQASFMTKLTKDLSTRPRMISWSADGKYIACSLYQQPLIVIDRRDVHNVQSPLQYSRVHCWGPAGYVLAMTRQGKIFGQVDILLWNVLSPEKKPSLLKTYKAANIDGLAWSAQEQIAVWVDKRIEVFTSTHATRESAVQIIVTNVVCGSNDVLCWSPNGSFLAAGAINGNVYCWERGANTFVLSINTRGNSERVYHLSWSPDSLFLVVAYGSRKVVVWSIRERRIVVMWENLPVLPYTVSISQHHCIAIASTIPKQELLLGYMNERAPSMWYPGHSFVAWSPAIGTQELVTLQANKETTLTVYQKNTVEPNRMPESS